MAAALIVKQARERHRRLAVASAGITASVGQSPPKAVIALMEHIGFDLSDHKAQQLTGTLAQRHDLILVMERAQQAFVEHHWPDLRGKVYRLGAWRNEDVTDPYGLANQRFVDCLRRIELHVADWGGVFWDGGSPAQSEHSGQAGSRQSARS